MEEYELRDGRNVQLDVTYSRTFLGKQIDKVFISVLGDQIENNYIFESKKSYFGIKKSYHLLHEDLTDVVSDDVAQDYATSIVDPLKNTYCFDNVTVLNTLNISGKHNENEYFFNLFTAPFIDTTSPVSPKILYKAEMSESEENPLHDEHPHWSDLVSSIDQIDTFNITLNRWVFNERTFSYTSDLFDDTKIEFKRIDGENGKLHIEHNFEFLKQYEYRNAKSQILSDVIEKEKLFEIDLESRIKELDR